MDLDPQHLLRSYGYAAVLAAPLVESTGVPFPGETMLLLAAAYAATTGKLNPFLVVLCAAAGAFLGDNLGYGIGRGVGREILERLVRRLRVDPKRLGQLDRLFARRGGVAVLIARFVAVLRTVGALVAGAAGMPYRVFVTFNLIGAVAWAAAYGLLGYELGHAYHRLGGTVASVAGIVGIAVLVGLLLLAVLARRRLERWALGEPEEPSGPGA